MALCLGIETSCDETAAALVGPSGDVASSVVASQAGIHARYGGVVPEVAARRHLETVLPVVAEALRQADAGWEDLDLVAVTRGPGLPAALLVGLAAGKAIAFARELPLVGVNHLAGHVYAHVLRDDPPGPAGGGGLLPRPAVCLVASGSHTDLAVLPAAGGLRLVGTTVDDAAGEAFDKVARMLGLGYPGGPALDRCARDGNPEAIAFPRTLRPLSGPRPADPAVVGGRYAFSFSGLKTAVARHWRTLGPAVSAGARADVAAAFQSAVVQTLVPKTLHAAAEFGATTVLLAGGVAANSALRAEMASACSAAGLELRLPPPRYCTDNAAMIAAAGWAAYGSGQTAGWDLDAEPNLALDL